MALSSCLECGAAVLEHSGTCLRCGRPLEAPSARKGVVPRALLALAARALFYVAVVLVAFSAFVVAFVATTSALLAR